MLENVKETWTHLQLPTATYRASKDKVPILGNLEEVVGVLEDSLVTVSAIAGRHEQKKHQNMKTNEKKKKERHVAKEGKERKDTRAGV